MKALYVIYKLNIEKKKRTMIKDRLKELKGIASNGDTSEVDGPEEDYVCVNLPTEKGPSFIEPLIKRVS